MKNRKTSKFYFWGEKPKIAFPTQSFSCSEVRRNKPGPLSGCPITHCCYFNTGTQDQTTYFLSTQPRSIQHPECPAPGWVLVFEREPFMPDGKGQLPTTAHPAATGPLISTESPLSLAERGRPCGPLLLQRAHDFHLASFSTTCASVPKSSSQGRKDTLGMLETKGSLSPDVIPHGTQIT